MRTAASHIPGLSARALQRWCQGSHAPNDTTLFWALIDHFALSDRSHPQWELALDAARREAREQQQRWQKPGRLHPPTELDAFARSTIADAPSYLWWHTELPHGKTTLLADYECDSPGQIDARYQAVSAEAGTHTRAGFLLRLHDALEIAPPTGLTTDEAACARLLRETAARTRARGRHLFLLMIDDLDADLGWPHFDTHPAAPHSIAAMLPVRPPNGVRIVVTTRRTAPVPADLVADHPLRLRACCRALTPTAGLPPAGPTQSPFDRAPLNREVIAFLALTGGWLRPQDLTQLTGSTVEEINLLLTHRENRAVVTDPRVPGGLRLASWVPAPEPHPRDSGRTVRLHTWAASFRDAGWPADTPPYLLTDYLRLLDDPAERVAFLLAPERQLRLADTLGPELVLHQLHHHRGGSARTGFLATVSWDLLCQRLRSVPAEAPALLALLGDLPRALALARSVTARPARAAALVQVAVTLASADQHDPTVIGLAEEAAALLHDAGPFTPRTPEIIDACTQITDAARALANLRLRDAAQLLFRAAARSGAADLAAQVEAMALDPDASIPELMEYALALAEERPEYVAVSVDLLRTVARFADKVLPEQGADASIPRRKIGDALRDQALAKMSEITAAPDPEQRLAAAAARSIQASALAEQGYPRKAATALHAVWDLLLPSLVEPGSPADRSHLGRELSATFEQIALAESATNPRYPAAKSALLTNAHLAAGRTGILGDDPTERARAVIEAAVDTSTPLDDTPFSRARRSFLTGNTALAREQATSALRTLYLDGPTPFAERHVQALLRALGTVGALSQAHRLVLAAPTGEARAVRHASLSLGCVLSGRRAEALAQARVAARLLTASSRPGTRLTVAQALAHSGDCDSALAVVALPSDGPDFSRTAALLAAGLLEHSPSRAIELSDAAALDLAVRLAADPSKRLRPLSALLLAHPRPDQPAGVLPDVLRTASRLATRPPRPRTAEPVVVLALLHHLGCPIDPAAVARLPWWSAWLRNERTRHTERALLAALEHNTAEVLHIASTAPDRTTWVAVLAAGAKVLSGAPTVLAHDDPLTSLCQALRPTAGPSPARPLFDALLRAGEWSHAIPMLPWFAPDLLPPLGDLVAAHTRPTPGDRTIA
ncbi:hypothetical protein [Kitasatospora fiedleri]|uniref:hypothetical protein n=1 Tax=Kitasatospora fiedleri TaxID=2991545 RepID=UPI00249CB1FE|nr:hypothetical protein [Kitasatospora fiedleri]